MRSFDGFGAFAAFLAEIAPHVEKSAEHGLAEGAKLIAKDARERLGHYEQAGWPGWQPLAEATKDIRQRQGYTPDDPLLRSGTLRENIVSEAEGREAVAGVKPGATEPYHPNSDIGEVAIWMEVGTSNGVPARPYLAPAGFVNAERVQGMVEEEVRAAMLGEAPRHRHGGSAS